MDSAGFAAALANARAGDEAAFALLYHLVQPALLRYLRGLATDAGEDVAADAWVEVVRSLDRFSGEAQGFTAWVFTIARRKAIDRSRYEGRRLTAVLPEHEVATAHEPDAADLLEQAEATEAALALVRTLPPDQAEAILLRVVAGLEIAQVAELMQRSNGAVRVLTHRGLQRLGATLAARSVRAEV
jgi:RNA polymerase sigma-70 factor, ECF subfamily